MGHGHSGMNRPAFEGMRLVVLSQSCGIDCVTAERLNVSRKVAAQVTVVRTAALVLDTTAEFLAPDATAVWSLDSGPPAPPPAQAAPFSILRI